MSQTVKIKKLNEKATIPTRGSEDAAGLDLYAIEDIIIYSRETLMVKTGIAMELPKGTVGLVYARSGLASKKGLAPANKVGVVDCDYRGEILIPLYNQSQCAQFIEAGERVAQMIIAPYYTPELIVVDELDDTERGLNGFGSTGSL